MNGDPTNEKSEPAGRRRGTNTKGTTSLKARRLCEGRIEDPYWLEVVQFGNCFRLGACTKGNLAEFLRVALVAGMRKSNLVVLQCTSLVSRGCIARSISDQRMPGYSSVFALATSLGTPNDD